MAPEGNCGGESDAGDDVAAGGRNERLRLLNSIVCGPYASHVRDRASAQPFTEPINNGADRGAIVYARLAAKTTQSGESSPIFT
jgi:hypothetical protein